MKKITLENIKMLDLGVSVLDNKWNHKYYKVEIVVNDDGKKILHSCGIKEFALLSTVTYCFMFILYKEPIIYNLKNERVFVNASGNIRATVDIYINSKQKVDRVNIHFVDFETIDLSRQF